MRSYEQFYEKRHLMNALTPDGKNRKVINLCLIESTLHDLSMRKQFLKDLAQAKKASKITAAVSAASPPRPQAVEAPGEPKTTTPTSPASIQIDNERSTTSVHGTAVPTDNAATESDARSNSLPRRESPYSDVQDFITSFANLLAPSPAPAGSANANGINLHGNMNLSAAEIIKRAANFVAPPPPLSSSSTPASAAAAAAAASNAATHAATSAVEAANRLTQPTLRGLPYEPFLSRTQRTAQFSRSNTEPPTPAAAPTSVPPSRATPAATPKPPSPAPSSRSSVSDNKYASLKAVFDKFVVDFNSDLADAFGSSPLTSREDDAVDTRATTPTSSPSAAIFKKETNVLEANGEKESAPQVPNKKSAITVVAHRATCDNCNKWIFGTRYKCFTCPDWYVHLIKLHLLTCRRTLVVADKRFYSTDCVTLLGIVVRPVYRRVTSITLVTHWPLSTSRRTSSGAVPSPMRVIRLLIMAFTAIAATFPSLASDTSVHIHLAQTLISAPIAKPTLLRMPTTARLVIILTRITFWSRSVNLFRALAPILSGREGGI